MESSRQKYTGTNRKRPPLTKVWTIWAQKNDSVNKNQCLMNKKMFK